MEAAEWNHQREVENLMAWAERSKISCAPDRETAEVYNQKSSLYLVTRVATCSTLLIVQNYEALLLICAVQCNLVLGHQYIILRVLKSVGELATAAIPVLLPSRASNVILVSSHLQA